MHEGNVTRATEAVLWAPLQAIAEAAFGFWSAFLILRAGPKSDQSLDAEAVGRWRCIVRAVSWVESKHGSFGGTISAHDPMQCGNPADSWWRQLIDPDSNGDRFIRGGQGTPNYYAGELPDAVSGLTDFPPAAKLSTLGNPSIGHGDAAFNPTMSFCWAIPYLIQRANTHAGVEPRPAKTFKCGDSSMARLVDGAVDYNGGGDPQYRTKILVALKLIGCGIPLDAKQSKPAERRRRGRTPQAAKALRKAVVATSKKRGTPDQVKRRSSSART